MSKLICLLALLMINFSFSANADSSISTIQQAQKENKHLYLFFYKKLDDKTQKSERIFDQATQQLGDKIKFSKVDILNPTEDSLVDRFNLKRTPMPFVIVLAPNGAITGGFHHFTEEQLYEAITSPGAANCIKALQDQKLVLLCLQNHQTAHNEMALRGVQDFKADPNFASASEIVIIDPSDPDEKKFLNQLNINVTPAEATTLLMAPPADVVGKYYGPTSKEQIISDLKSATSGCCGPGGCCPGGKCGPK